MNALPIVPAAFAAGSIATAAMAAAPPRIQPPMNNFDFAFYTCDDRGAFQVTYDSETPTVATLTTNDNNKQYVLPRKRAADGAQFSDGATSFWTDGRKVVVEGTTTPMQNCKMRSN